MKTDKYTILTTKKLEAGYKSVALTSKLNLGLERGTLTSLIGTNGCGKSTLIRTLSGLQAPVGGDISVLGQKLDSLTAYKKARLISHVLTDSDYLRSITVRNMVAMGRFPHTNFLGHLSSKDWEVVEQSMMKVKIEHKRDSLLFELSDGERQRTLIAKALAQDTPIIFLDEPTSFLDMRNKIEIMELLRTLAHTSEKAILLSTHDIDIALQTSDRIWLMNSGNITSGIPEDLIISGMIGKTFRSDAFTFSLETGSFKVGHRGAKGINVTGDDGMAKKYTVQALQRVGYVLDTASPVTVNVKPVEQDGLSPDRYMAEWRVIHERKNDLCHSIEDVLYAVREIAVKS
ncbi:MAG: ABC transporter ATP-binding protein [Paludibacteraceae bacterium]|nr:ABC transporter ATP-binding protein [Paludibacteraceae bacterium]